MIAFARAADAGKLIELLNGCLLTRRSVSTDFNSTTRTSTTLINAGCAARVRNGLHVNIAFWPALHVIRQWLGAAVICIGRWAC